MSIGQRLFAASCDLLNSRVERRLSTYRIRTAGRARGEVLEIGGGTGANLPCYPPDARLTFVEPNPHMARRLRRKAGGLGRDIRVVSDVGEQLAFPDSSFDSVVTSLVLCMVEDVEQVVAEARRVLRPGGAFYFYEHVASTRSAGRAWQSLLNPIWRFVTTDCNLDRDITETIETAGFQRVDVERFDLRVGLPVTIPNILGVAWA